MADPIPNAELMRSLGRLVRGLSAVFWGLPITLLVSVQGAATDFLRPMGMFPPVLGSALLFFGLLQMGHFQKQERVWQAALDRAKLLGLVNIGLSPFIYLWNKQPTETFFAQSVALLTLSSLLFLFSLNQVLQRLTAMLPDETLRTETKLFTTLNRYLLLALVALLAIYFLLTQIDSPPLLVEMLLIQLKLGRHSALLFLVLLPLAMTMTLVWKIKEVVLSSVFGQGR